MKVLICHNQYQQRGGEDVAVGQQSELLRKRGHQVVHYQRLNRELLGYGALQKARFPVHALYSSRAYRDIRTIVARERPDLAHVHNVFPLISPSIYRALGDAGVPIIQTVHNYRLLCPAATFYTHGHVCDLCRSGATYHAVLRRCFRNSYAESAIYAASIGLHRRLGTFDLIRTFIALTDFVAQKMVEGNLTSRQKIHVLGNFLQAPLPVLKQSEARHPYALFVGRLAAEKGVHPLLDAFLSPGAPRLKVAGDGPERQRMQERVAASGTSTIEMLGFQEGSAKWDLIRGAMFVVIPSLWFECFPFVLLESLACGTPVLVAGHGSLEALVLGRGIGMTFRPGDSEDLRTKMRQMTDNTTTRRKMGLAGRELVERKYSEEEHYHRLLGIYSAACS